MEWVFPALARQLKLKQQKSVISGTPLCWTPKSWTTRTLLVTSCLRIPICSTDHQMHGAICPFWLAETRENALPGHRDKFSGHNKMLCILEPLPHFHAHWLPVHIHSQPRAPVPLFWVPLSCRLNPNVCPLGSLIQAWPQVHIIKPCFSATWGRQLEGVLLFLGLGFRLRWSLPLPSHTSQEVVPSQQILPNQ